VLGKIFLQELFNKDLSFTVPVIFNSDYKL